VRAPCQHVPELVAGSVIEGNCVAVRRDGKQPEVNRQSKPIRREAVASRLIRGEARKQPQSGHRAARVVGVGMSGRQGEVSEETCCGG
jgi:hypothetical protein